LKLSKRKKGAIFFVFLGLGLGLGGNFAPFFEMGVGAYLDGRTRAHWLIPLLIFTFLYNIPICTKAFADLFMSKITRKNNNHWKKTTHSGNGNNYIMNFRES